MGLLVFPDSSLIYSQLKATEGHFGHCSGAGMFLNTRWGASPVTPCVASSETPDHFSSTIRGGKSVDSGENTVNVCAM